MRSGEQTSCLNPATGEVVGYSSVNTKEELKAAVERARAAQPGWEATPLKERRRAMMRVRDYLASHADELAEIISKDNGKTRVDALVTEILPAAMAVSYYVRKAKGFLKDKHPFPANLLLANKLSLVRRVPYGVISIISPWNYPFSIPFSEVVMGLLAGNAVILKVATQTQLVGRALERCFRAAELPEGVFTHLNLPGSMAGDALLEAGVNKFFFTGSVPVGKKLMAKAAESLTPLCLELGGNDAMLVCPDADLERAAAGAVWAGMQNCGQSCGGVERIYVHADVYETFLELLGKKVEGLRVGRDTDGKVDMGAMTTRRQMETVRLHVDDALKKGAVIYAQSEYPDSTEVNFLPAMVLTEVNHEMLVMKEETFGPVVGVMKVDDMEQGLHLANDSNLGLTGSVWTRNRKNGFKLACRIQAGVVMINDHLMSHGLAETPWGGFKESGIGRTHGGIGFSEMTQPQCIVNDILPGVKKDMWWHPHGPEVYLGVKGSLDFLYGKPKLKRFWGLIRLMKVFPRTFTR